MAASETALLKINTANCPDALGETRVALTAKKILLPSGYQTFIYNGRVLPDTAGSAGTDKSFLVWSDWTAPIPPDGRVFIVDDPEAVDGKAFRLVDTADDQTVYYSTPAASISAATGATVVARIKTESFSNAGTPRRRGNVSLWGPGISADVHWGGDTGVIRDELRNAWAPNLANDPQVDGQPHPLYHIIRVTGQDMGGSLGMVINVYFDEDPVPVLHLTNAGVQNSQLPAGAGGFSFGVRSGSDVQPIDIDYVAGTDAGAFAPGEEVPCLGFALQGSKSPWPDSCAEPPGRIWADADNDNDVDMADFAVLQLCYTIGDNGPVPALPEWCICMDHGDDDLDGKPQLSGHIDDHDLRAFLDCAAGPGVPWTQTLTPNCKP